MYVAWAILVAVLGCAGFALAHSVEDKRVGAPPARERVALHLVTALWWLVFWSIWMTNEITERLASPVIGRYPFYVGVPCIEMVKIVALRAKNRPDVVRVCRKLIKVLWVVWGAGAILFFGEIVWALLHGRTPY